VGGVNSPVRSFRAVGGSPVFFEGGRGAYLNDVDGRKYLDLVGSWGANILGNAPPAIVAAVRATAKKGLTFGAPSPLEHELAEEIRTAAPSLKRMRFVSSGTEAVMSAVRVARGFTTRPKVVKFAGGYHGHSDGLLARAGSGVATHSLPDSAGVPRSVVGETIVVPYNDRDALERAFERHGASIAAVVIEPVAGNMGVVPPALGYLAEVGRIAHRHGALMIADEVMTGFRLRRGTIHESLGLRADLVTLGKIVGGGMPIGVYGGRQEIMETVAPLGPVYQAGTLSGHPLAMAAGAAMLEQLTPAVYRDLETTGAALEEQVRRLADEEGVAPFTVQRVGSMLGIFFASGPITNAQEAELCDRARYARFFHAALDHGVYLPPSALETTFVSAATRPRELARAEPALRAAFHAAWETPE
jgi:glutamate-1-semialdehyde 2,1-aminomutase